MALLFLQLQQNRAVVTAVKISHVNATTEYLRPHDPHHFQQVLRDKGVVDAHASPVIPGMLRAVAPPGEIVLPWGWVHVPKSIDQFALLQNPAKSSLLNRCVAWLSSVQGVLR